MAPERGTRPASNRRADTPAKRTSSRPSQRGGAARTKQSEPAGEEHSTSVGVTAAPQQRRGLRITQRALILLGVIVVLLVSYATTLRVYFTQQYQLGQSRQAIQAHEDAIATLEDEIARWQDPEYVKIQARERLGWVLPGETGFRVVGPDGEPFGGGQHIGAGALPDGEYDATWWDRMWGSVQAADNPTVEEQEQQAEAEKEPIRVEPEPAEGP